MAGTVAIGMVIINTIGISQSCLRLALLRNAAWPMPTPSGFLARGCEDPRMVRQTHSARPTQVGESKRWEGFGRNPFYFDSLTSSKTWMSFRRCQQKKACLGIRFMLMNAILWHQCSRATSAVTGTAPTIWGARQGQFQPRQATRKGSLKA